MDKFFLDYETRSVLPLDQYGLDRYVHHPTTSVLLAAYAFGDRAPKLWQPHLDPKIPAELEDALCDPMCQVWSWNAAFERAVTKYVLGIDKPVEEFRDPMLMARYLSLPGALNAAGEILGLGTELAKIKDGDRLIKLFCEAESEGGEETLFGISEPAFRDWRTHPRDWALFAEYCKQDVIAERAAAKKMQRFPLPEQEWENWFLDQQINERGWPVDKPTVDGASAIVLKALEPLHARIKELTGCANPNSRDQILAWLQTQNYIFDSLNKDFVARAMAGECDLTLAAREALEIRGQTAKSSVSKYTLLSDMTGDDGWLRHQYTFYGAHSGRWAMHGVNMGNLPRPSKDVEKNLDQAVELVRLMDYDGIIQKFGKPLEVVSSVLRSAFRAPSGYKFVVADLNAIENRGLGYLARCEGILKVFREGLDPYLSFAARLYGEPYEKLLAEYQDGDSTKRTMCKPPVLGAGYGLGPGREYMEDGVEMWTGLLGYARKMNVEMTLDQAEIAIQIFRESYPEVKRLWKDMERAAAFAIRHPGEVSGVGSPHSKRDEEYFAENGRMVLPPIVSFKCTGKRVLEMLLPSNRSLCFVDPRVQNETRTWKKKDPRTGIIVEKEYQTDVVYHKVRDQKTKRWMELSEGTFGGRWVENAVQAVSRDVLVNGMILADQMGFQIVGHTYDEIVALAPENGGLGLKELCDCMVSPPGWCGVDFPLGAEGFESEIYRK